MYLGSDLYKVYSEEFIQGLTSANKAVNLRLPEVVKQIAASWMRVIINLGEKDQKGSYVAPEDMARANIMFRSANRQIQGEPVVVDIGLTKRTTPYEIASTLYGYYQNIEGIKQGILEVLGPTEGKEFIDSVARRV